MAFRLRLLFSVLALAGALAATTPDVRAADVNRVAAVVNDEAISVLDLQMRLRLAQATSNIPDNPEIRQRLVSQVLRKMIEERLMAQEARRLKINVSKEDVLKHVATMEKQNRMEPGGMERVLKNAGVPMSVMYRQVEAELSWARVIRMALAPRIKITEDEVKDHLEMLQANIGQPEYLLAEIMLPVDAPEREGEVAQAAQRIIDQLRQGAGFQNVARQFSQSASAAAGGDLDWVPVGSLEPEVANVLARMAPNSLSPPIRTVDGYTIMLLRDRRVFGQKSAASGGGGGGADQLAIVQLYVPAGNDRAGAVRRIQEISAGARNCAQLEEAGKKNNLPQSGRGTADLSKMNAQARQFISSLKLMQVSQPLQDPTGVRVIMVCGKAGESSQPEGGLPSPEQIKSVLERQRLEMLAQRHMRDLKRAAFVEVKL